MLHVDDADLRGVLDDVQFLGSAPKRAATAFSSSATSASDRRALQRVHDAVRSALAARACEVRANPQRRARYDIPVPDKTSGTSFITDNPFAGLPQGLPRGLAPGTARQHFELGRPKPSPVVVLPVSASLQEVNDGATKTVTATLRVPAPPGGDATALVERTFSVEVEPGALPGTRFLFPGEGHQDPGRPPGGVELVLAVLPHPRFSRDAANPADLVLAEAVSLREALLGCTIEIDTLDGRLIRVAITDVVRPGYEKRLCGEGLPRGRGRGRGDLVLRLSVRFPTCVPRPCKALLDQALRLAEDGVDDEAVAAHGDHAVAHGVARAVLEDKMRRQAER